LAFLELEQDGGYPELQAHVRKCLREVDPNFKTTDDYNKASPEEIQAANSDVLDFLSDMDAKDKVLRGSGGSGMDKSIFGGERQDTGPTDAQLDMAAQIEKKREAEAERFKGNEYMKAKEYEEAVKCYSKAIDMNPGEAANYSNRAMAYLRLKVYSKVVKDADKAIEIDPDYVKAYHRRGKAYLEMKKY
jgi:tetratricopeptide (TPR) repeat protein